MRVLVLFVLFTANLSFAKSTKPTKGVYEIIKNQRFEQCAQFASHGSCEKQRIIDFKKGQFIESHDSYFNSDINDWDVGFILNGQNRSFPKTHVRYSAPINCKFLLKTYKTLINNLDHSCKVDSDCKTVNLRYNSCAGERGVSKEVRKYQTQDLSKARNRVRKVCKYIHPPCPAIMVRAFCNKGRCDQKEGLQNSSAPLPHNKVQNSNL